MAKTTVNRKQFFEEAVDFLERNPRFKKQSMDVLFTVIPGYPKRALYNAKNAEIELFNSGELSVNELYFDMLQGILDRNANAEVERLEEQIEDTQNVHALMYLHKIKKAETDRREKARKKEMDYEGYKYEYIDVLETENTHKSLEDISIKFDFVEKK